MIDNISDHKNRVKEFADGLEEALDDMTLCLQHDSDVCLCTACNELRVVRAVCVRVRLDEFGSQRELIP